MFDNIVKKTGNQLPKKESTDIHAPSPPPAAERGGAVTGKGSSMGEGVRTSSRPRGETPPRGLLCPVCSVAMRIEYMGGVELDRCPECGGIFLDKGELQALTGADLSSYEKSCEQDEVLIYTPHGLSGHVRNPE